MIVSEKERNEDAGDHDIAKAEHGKVACTQSVLKQILGEKMSLIKNVQSKICVKRTHFFFYFLVFNNLLELNY